MQELRRFWRVAKDRGAAAAPLSLAAPTDGRLLIHSPRAAGGVRRHELGRQGLQRDRAQPDLERACARHCPANARTSPHARAHVFLINPHYHLDLPLLKTHTMHDMQLRYESILHFLNVLQFH